MKRLLISILIPAAITVLAAVPAALTVSLIVSWPGLVWAGDLEPPAGPDDPGSAMYTIEDVYDYLSTGLARARRTGGFTEPASAPGSTGRTLDEVYAIISGRCITCDGTLSGTRWCDNGDGTVTDMSTGLVWLKNAGWGLMYAQWVNAAAGTNAHDRAAQAKNGTPASLTDGSVEGDWRLPTKNELYILTHGTEQVSSGTPRAFTGVQSNFYWSSTTYSSSTGSAWVVSLLNGTVSAAGKGSTYYVWPVRGNQ